MLNAWPSAFERQVMASVDSTSLEAARQAPHVSSGKWIMALEQTHARGRRGRPWVNPKGNFAASLVYRPTGDMQNRALRSFVASMALFDTFVQITGRPSGFALKWPNDVLLNGGKVAGILLEAGPSDTLIIGIGVNLIQAPSRAEVEQGAVAPVDLMSETGTQCAPDDFLDLLAPNFAHYETQMATYGFEPIRAAWLKHAARLGDTITARTSHDEQVGTFETIDAAGQLILRTSRGQQAVAAADVFF